LGCFQTTENGKSKVNMGNIKKLEGEEGAHYSCDNMVAEEKIFANL